MTWYERKTGTNTETGEQYPVIVEINGLDSSLYPTLFFIHFNNIPTYNAINQCLDTLDMTEFTKDGLSEEETQEKNITCSPVDVRQEVRGAQCKAKGS